MLSTAVDVPATLDEATAASVKVVEGCDYAGISLVGKGGVVRTVSPTHDIVINIHQAQYELGDGPCLQSIWEEETVYSRDLRAETRWPRWASHTADLGIRSSLSLQLFVGSDSFGALNLFSARPDAFAADDRVSALALAAHVAVAMTAAQDKQDLNSALVNRTVIGQAEGMLMHVFSINPD